MKPLLSCCLLTLLTLALLSAPTKAGAHAAYWEQSLKKSYGVEYVYSDGSPIVNSDVAVFSPSDDMNPIYTGKTDNNGYFAFIPTIPGNWILETNDNAGHLVIATIKVDDPKSVAPQDGAPVAPVVSTSNIDRAVENATKPLKIGLIVSIFLNLALLAMIAKRKKTSPTA